MLVYGLQNTRDNVGNLYSKILSITSTEKLKDIKSLDSKVWKLPSSVGGTAWRRRSPEVWSTRSGHQGTNPVKGFAGGAREAVGAVEVERGGWGVEEEARLAPSHRLLWVIRDMLPNRIIRYNVAPDNPMDRIIRYKTDPDNPVYQKLRNSEILACFPPIPRASDLCVRLEMFIDEIDLGLR